jgi:hypothetical protein
MSINWPKLYNAGRVKAIGIPWSPEESNAIYNLKIPVGYVRDGIITLEAYTKILEEETKGEKPVERWVISELRIKASELGLSFTPEATEDSLIKVIKKELKNKAELEKQNEIVKQAEQNETEIQAKIKAEAQILVEEAKKESKEVDEKLKVKEAKNAEREAKKAKTLEGGK